MHEMTELNRAILGRQSAPEVFASALNEQLAGLGEAESFTPLSAQRLVVLLGFAGASLGRHYQEQDAAQVDAGGGVKEIDRADRCARAGRFGSDRGIEAHHLGMWGSQSGRR